MYINAVANSVMLHLYLGHDFYNIIFKIEHKLYIASGSGPPPPPANEKFWMRSCLSRNIIRELESRRMRWAGTCGTYWEKRGAYRVLVGKPEGERPLGRPRHRWEDNNALYLK
jgi:hypothetical protein